MEKFACKFTGCNVGGGDVFGFKVLPIDGVWPSEIDFSDVDLETSSVSLSARKSRPP